MQTVQSPNGIKVSFQTSGDGPPLVLIHGSFSDHQSNWEFVEPYLTRHFSGVAIARRGRGETDATEGHCLRNEVIDAAAVIASLNQPVYVAGHSYGALVALEVAALLPGHVRKLALYEPPWPQAVLNGKLPKLTAIAETGDWDSFAATFFRDCLFVDDSTVEWLRQDPSWRQIVADAPASLRDLLALNRYEFQPSRFRSLAMPVLLQTGSESPSGLYVTDALAAAIPRSQVEQLPGQAHEAPTTAPSLYAESVIGFLLQ